MNEKKMADVLRRLLAMLPGVQIDRMRTHPSGLAIVIMRVSEPSSIGLLASSATNNNLRLLVRGHSRGRSLEDWSSPERVRYELWAGDYRSPMPQSPRTLPTTIRLFCEQLIRDLRELGRIEPEEAKALFFELAAAEAAS